MEKWPRAPVKNAAVMERSSPESLCHSVMGTRLRLSGIASERVKACQVVRRKIESPVRHRVEIPTKDGLAHGPTGVTLMELFERDRLHMTQAVGVGQRAQNLIDCMES